MAEPESKPAAPTYCDRPTEHESIDTSRISEMDEWIDDRAVAAGPAEPSYRLPGYDIEHLLGRGGMAVVFKARQLALNRVVALKMILSGPLAAADDVRRFQLEAEAVGSLDHPHIVPIYDVGFHDGQHYFSMKYIEGGTLARDVHRYRADRRAAAQLVATIARAVHYAHQRGILHRDLKPSNILVDAQGQPHVADFGLAKLVSRESQMTATGMIVGTPEYMAPEQAASKKDISVAADVWGLGAILYELLTGQPPFSADTPLHTIFEVLGREPKRPRSLDAHIDRDLEIICLRCLQKEPERRYPSAELLAEDLERWLRREPIRARSVRLPERMWSWARRRPAFAALAAGTLLMFLLGSVVVFAAWLYALAGWDRAGTQERRAELAQLQAEQRRDQAEANLYFSRIAQADLEIRESDPLLAQSQLDQCRPRGPGELDRRGWEWHYLAGLLHADLATLAEPHVHMVHDLAFSPDGELLLSCGGSPFRDQSPDRVRLWRPWHEDGPQPWREFPHPRLVRRAAFAGSNLVWVGDDGVVARADFATGQTPVRRHLPTPFNRGYLSPDGNRVVAFHHEHGLRLWDAATGAELLSRPELTRLNLAGFSPDSQTLCLLASDAVHCIDLRTGQECFRTATDVTHRSQPAMSSDGRYLAVGNTEGLIHLWDLATGQLVRTFAGHAGDVLTVAFSPDGRFLASGGADATVRLWSVGSSSALLRLRGHQGRVSSLAFHPTGQFLASGSSQPADIKLWDLTRPQECLVIGRTEELPRIEGLGFVDDDTLGIVRAQGLLQRIDAGTGTERSHQAVDVVRTWRAPTQFAGFSSGGGRLALACGSNPKEVLVLNANTGAIVQRLEHRFEVYHVVLNGDGTRLAVSTASSDQVGQRELHVWDTTTGTIMARVSPATLAPHGARRGRAFGMVALDDRGGLLAYDEYAPKPGTSDETVGRVCVVELPSGQRCALLEGFPNQIDKLRLSGDGRLLAVAGEAIGLRVYAVADGTWLHGAPLPGSMSETYFDLAFSPDGRRLAGASRVQVGMWDVASGQLVLALHGAPPRPSDNGFNPRICWSPNGQRLAASHWNSTATIWDAAERESLAARQTARNRALQRAPLAWNR